MATETMTLINITKKVSKDGEVGTMLVFDKLLPKGHVAEGKHVCKYISPEDAKDFDLKQTGKTGWRFDVVGEGKDMKTYVGAPLIDLWDIRDHDSNTKLTKAKELGLLVQI